MPLLYSLFFAELANEEGAVMFTHDAVLQTLDDNLLAIWHFYHVAFGFNEFYAITNDSIIILVMFGESMETAPGSKVTPSKFRWHDIGKLCLLHDGIVDGDLFTSREEFIDNGLLILGEETIHHPVHNTCNLWCMLTKF